VRYRCLGSSGLRVPVLGLGCRDLGTRLDQHESEQLVKAAIDAGVTFFDTADIYGDGTSEQVLGTALKNDRDKVILATKFRWATGPGPNDRGASRIHIRSAVEGSLRRLGTDRIDLYQIHAPDPATPIEETLGALDDLVSAGKVLYAGASNLAAWQLVDGHWHAAVGRHARLVSNQAPLNLLDLGAEREMLPAARHCGIGFIACLVLARGFLAGSFGEHSDRRTLSARRAAYLTPASLRKRAAIASLAEAAGVSPLRLALGCIADLPGVSSVLAGATNASQLAEAAGAVSSELPADERDAVLARLRALAAGPELT
jgi:aryl-alcohol dehydrogenase-like predicted oxidoreductase